MRIKCNDVKLCDHKMGVYKNDLQNCTCTKYIKIYLNMCICVLFRYNISEYNAAFLSADFLT